MTDAEVHSEVARFEMKNFMCPVKIELRRSPGFDGFDLFVTIAVPDRDTGSPTTINHARIFRTSDVRSPLQLHDMVYHTVKAAVLHELDESWRVDGVRVRDPHAGGRP